MGMLNNEIKSTQQSIGELCKEITILRESYAQMLRYAQKNKTNTDKLLFIFSSKDYKEAYQRYIFFRQFGDLQKEKLAQIQSKTNELSKRTSELELKRINQEKLLQQELKNSKELNKEKTEKQKTVNQLQKKEKQLAKNLKNKQQQVKKLQQQIDNAIAAEVLVVGVHPRSEVTTVCPVVSAVTPYGVNALVYPVPDKSALHVGAAAHHVVELS